MSQPRTVLSFGCGAASSSSRQGRWSAQHRSQRRRNRSPQWHLSGDAFFALECSRSPLVGQYAIGLDWAAPHSVPRSCGELLHHSNQSPRAHSLFQLQTARETKRATLCQFSQGGLTTPPGGHTPTEERDWKGKAWTYQDPLRYLTGSRAHSLKSGKSASGRWNVIACSTPAKDL